MESFVELQIYLFINSTLELVSPTSVLSPIYYRGPYDFIFGFLIS